MLEPIHRLCRGQELAPQVPAVPAERLNRIDWDKAAFLPDYD